VAGLAYAADNYETDIRTLGRDLLDRHLARQDDASVRGELKDEKAPVRRAAARAGAKRPALGGDLIGLLADDNAEVRAAAHDALVRLAGGEDFGPAEAGDKAAREAAQEKWRAWWARRGGR
jgi:hypothetical protein